MEKVLLRGIQAELVKESRGKGFNYVVFMIRPCVQILIWEKITESKKIPEITCDGNHLFVKKTSDLKKILKEGKKIINKDGKKIINFELFESSSIFKRCPGLVTLRVM